MSIGILGGSGLYDIEGLQDVERVSMDTPFGAPSDRFVRGRLEGHEVLFLPRHGVGHRIMPSEINHRANIFAMKQLGVERVISVSAVGSLKEDIHPRDIVLPDQYFDRTKQSAGHTFFGEGIVAHVSFAEPGCPELRDVIADCARKVLAGREESATVQVREGGTYVNMEGPAFSSKAESFAYRKLGFDIIGMTSLPEAKLCKEAELCYQAMSMVTDYDCWHESEEPVTVETVIGHLSANTALAKDILKVLVARLAGARACGCGSALKNAIITRPDAVPEETKQRLAPIVGKYC